MWVTYSYAYEAQTGDGNFPVGVCHIEELNTVSSGQICMAFDEFF